MLAGTTYKLRLILADAAGLHDTYVKLFSDLPGSDHAFELKAIISSTAVPIVGSGEVSSSGNATEVTMTGAYSAANPTSPQIQVAAAVAVTVRS